MPQNTDKAPAPSGVNPRALPVRPLRARGKRRFESVIREADRLILEEGLEGFSIPALAERLGYTRTSIYKFFPTPYAILNELTSRYLNELTAVLERKGPELVDLPWESAVTEMVRTAAAFHNANPVGRILILGGAVTDDSYRATEYTIEKLGALTNALLAQQGIHLRKRHPNVASLAVEIGTSIFRVSQFYFRKLTPEYIEEAAYGMRSYLSRYLETASVKARRAHPRSEGGRRAAGASSSGKS